VPLGQHILQLMLKWKVYHFHDTGPSSPIKNTNRLSDTEVLQPDGSNLAAFLYSLGQTNRDFYQRIVSTIRLAAPFFDDFVLRPVKDNPETILLRWRDKGSRDDFDASALSDGTLRFICLATLLLQPDPPSTIIIDEPELGLHPYAIVLLASILRSVSTERQIIVSTQSVTLVDQFTPEDIVVVERKDNQSTFERRTTQELDDWLRDYTLGELWEKNILGGRPR
jgi:predicted ATPase